MQSSPDKTERKAKNMAVLGIISGVIALIMFSDPPMALLFGALALIFAWLSHSYTKRFSRSAIVALVLGFIGIAVSVFVFFSFMAALRIMDDTESIAASMDPASAQQFRDLINYYREVLSGSIQ